MTTAPRITAPSTATIGSNMNHGCGRRSRTISSLRWSSFGGNATLAAYFHAALINVTRSAPAQLVETAVADAEVVGHLMDDGHPHLADHLLLGPAQPQDRPAENGDPIGHDHPRVARVALG